MGKIEKKNLSSLVDGWDLSEEDKCCDANCCFWTRILRGPNLGRLFQGTQSK